MHAYRRTLQGLKVDGFLRLSILVGTLNHRNFKVYTGDCLALDGSVHHNVGRTHEQTRIRYGPMCYVCSTDFVWRSGDGNTDSPGDHLYFDWSNKNCTSKKSRLKFRVRSHPDGGSRKDLPDRADSEFTGTPSKAQMGVTGECLKLSLVLDSSVDIVPFPYFHSNVTNEL